VNIAFKQNANVTAPYMDIQ